MTFKNSDIVRFVTYLHLFTQRFRYSLGDTPVIFLNIVEK